MLQNCYGDDTPGTQRRQGVGGVRVAQRERKGLEACSYLVVRGLPYSADVTGFLALQAGVSGHLRP